MNLFEHLLVVLNEEQNELSEELEKSVLLMLANNHLKQMSAATSKALRFGVYEQRDLPTSNHERIQKEFNDLLAVIDVLNDQFDFCIVRDEQMIKQKREKLKKYVGYSVKLGLINDEEA